MSNKKINVTKKEMAALKKIAPLLCLHKSHTFTFDIVEKKNKHLHKCKNCGVEFHNYNHTRVYCGRQCMSEFKLKNK